MNEAFLEWARAHDWEQPTFVWIHYMDPHGPYAPPPEIEALFVDDELAQAEGRVPLEKELAPGESPNKLLDALPEYQRRADGEDRVAKFVARYDGEIRFVDEAFGQVVEVLRERRVWDPSAVIFTADHGESLGEHGLWFCHGWFANDATLRVPLLIKRPGQTEGASVGEQVTNLDVAPTILALAGIPLDRPWAGTDVLGELGDRGPVVVENSDYYPEKIYGVRTTRWKYLIERRSGREELYDLVADPHERENLAESPGHAAVLADLTVEAGRLWDFDAFDAAVRESQARRLVVYEALRNGAFYPWDFEPLQKASERYMRNHRNLDTLETEKRFPRGE
jgi:choline-sulfatase